MLWWAKKDYRALKDIARQDGYGWRTFPKLFRLRRSKVSPTFYNKVVKSMPWDSTPMPQAEVGQWVAAKAEDGNITQVYHI